MNVKQTEAQEVDETKQEINCKDNMHIMMHIKMSNLLLSKRSALICEQARQQANVTNWLNHLGTKIISK